MQDRTRRKAFYSPSEFAEMASVHPSTVLEMIHSGKLFAVRLSERIYRIPLATVLSVLYPQEIQRPTVAGGPADEQLRSDLESMEREQLPQRTLTKA